MEADSLLDPLLANMAARLLILKSGDRYKQFIYLEKRESVCKVDLFITRPEQWGVVMTLRTGPANFSRDLVTTKQKGGLLPSHLKVKDGRVWAGSKALDTSSEEKFFDLLGLKWIEPRNRG
jgi:DNA polymerase/3'-5' exonuclease PolX